ncbi:MAG: hypothetical protein PHI48_03395 [Bacteroidales bacterium]|nr:hypothetical protein [Bacteroidales bacterium]
MSDNTISLYKLRSKISKNGLDPFNYQIDQIESLKLTKKTNPKYVEPIFSLQASSIEGGSFDNATIILISAAGATGKTSLTEHLSFELKAPIFDLSKHDPVASNSLTGLLFNSMDLPDFTDYSAKLKAGKSTMIIDALDEGFLKTTVDGFYAFLDNIARMSTEAKGVPFVLLGRTNIVELVTLYLEAKNIKVALLQIEPFTVDAAKSFVDKHVDSESKTRFEDQYIAVRDYIVDAIEGFFKNQSEINHKQYLQFIGYAPVLLAISTLLNDNGNYHALLENLKLNNRRNIQLVIDIIERILKRDKEEKIVKLLLPSLIGDRDEPFVESAKINIYTIEEQCARLLCSQFGEDFNPSVTGDIYFDLEYNKQIKSWLKEHPFLSNNGKIQNVVFESYIIAKLIKKEEYKDCVFRYLQSLYRNAYMLFYIFDELVSTNRIVDKDFVSYLFDSLKALDKKGHYSTMELVMQSIDENTGDIECDLNFFKADNDNEDCCYTVKTNINDTISLGSEISNMTIDLPLTIKLSSNKADCIPPAYIKCDTIRCSACEILLNSGSDNNSIIFECKNFVVECSEKDTLPMLTSQRNFSKEQFKIICNNSLTYPFVQYLFDASLQKAPVDIIEKYHKMRRIFLMFRSHSKGDLARYKEKIDNRIGNSYIGKSVIAALLSAEIIYSRDIMYFVNTEKMASELGVKYNDIRSSVINDKIQSFLSKI